MSVAELEMLLGYRVLATETNRKTPGHVDVGSQAAGFPLEQGPPRTHTPPYCPCAHSLNARTKPNLKMGDRVKPKAYGSHNPGTIHTANILILTCRKRQDRGKPDPDVSPLCYFFQNTGLKTTSTA